MRRLDSNNDDSEEKKTQTTPSFVDRNLVRQQWLLDYALLAIILMKQ